MSTDFPGDRGVFTLRRFLACVARSVRPATAPTGLAASLRRVGSYLLRTDDRAWPAWEEFVPTLIRLRSSWNEEEATVRPDVDGSQPARFMTGIKIVERERQYPMVRVQQVAVRAYLAPPARFTEVASRAEYLSRSGYPMALAERDFGVTSSPFAALSLRERRQLEFIPQDERIALTAVLAAPGGITVAFSADGSWPAHPLVLQVARRTGCTIVRRRLEEIPPHVRRHVRIVRYRTVEEEPCDESVLRLRAT